MSLFSQGCLFHFLPLLLLITSAPLPSIAGITSRDEVMKEHSSHPILASGEGEYPHFLTEEDFAAARLLPDIPEQVNTSVLYNRNLFEGDILGGPFGPSSLIDDDESSEVPGARKKRQSLRNQYFRWPNGRIPYYIKSNFAPWIRARIAQAMQDFSDLTCVRFVPTSGMERDFVTIFYGDGCFSNVGRVGGQQWLSLGNDCFSKGVILHELMHVLGFHHEQSRTDRDRYVKINWRNIKWDMWDNFLMYNHYYVDDLGTNYDYGSIMHYARDAFSPGPQWPSIEPYWDVHIGQTYGLSKTDVYRVNKLYNCQFEPEPETTTERVTTTTPKPETTTDPITTTTVTPENTTEPVTPSTLTSITSTEPTLSSNASSVNTTEEAPTTRVTTEGLLRSREVQPTTLKTLKEFFCADNQPDCSWLAAKGHCVAEEHARFMQLNCRKTCQQCGVYPECRDEKHWCEIEKGKNWWPLFCRDGNWGPAMPAVCKRY